jgi:hypothetical protein
VHADHDPVGARPAFHGDGPPPVQVCVEDGFGDGDEQLVERCGVDAPARGFCDSVPGLP